MWFHVLVHASYVGGVCSLVLFLSLFFFFFKQKTAYEMRISDWSSDVCSSDLADRLAAGQPQRVQPSGPSETRALGERFNAMLDALAESDSVRRTLLSRSEERRVGKECGSTCRSRWSTYH